MPSNLSPNKTVLIVLSGTTLGVVIIGALAMFFHRRKKRRERSEPSDAVADVAADEVLSSKTSARLDTRRARRRIFSINNSFFSPKKDFETSGIYTRKQLQTLDTAPPSLTHITSNDDVTSDNDDVISNSFHSSVSETNICDKTSQSDANSLATTVVPTNHLKPSQLLEAGMDLVLKAQTRWKLAMDQLDEEVQHEISEEELFKLRAQLSQLLELSDAMQGSCSTELLSHLCAGAVADAALVEMDREYEATKLKYLADDNSDLESFFSTLETIDISNLAEHKKTFKSLHLYEQGLHQLEEGNLQYRCLRTKQLDCSSDTEFLAKLYCVRKAFDLVFADEENRRFFRELGRDLVGALLTHANKSSKEFEDSYDGLMDFVNVPENWHLIEEELKQRNVRVMSFFDIVIDFFLFDAFDDLDSAPPSIVSIINNSWITNGFKETAILTFVWSVLKTKKAMLKQPNGFMARFYSISEVTSPVLAWGFLGPGGPFKQLCLYFKDQIMGYIKDIFNFDVVRYTSCEELCDDVMRLARSRGQKTRDKMMVDLSLWE